MVKNKPKPCINIGPGYTIKIFLEGLKLNQKYLAEYTGLSEKHISKLINDKARVTLKVAILLSKFFNTSVTLWIDLDTNYRLNLQQDPSMDGIECMEKVRFRKNNLTINGRIFSVSDYGHERYRNGQTYHFLIFKVTKDELEFIKKELSESEIFEPHCIVVHISEEKKDAYRFFKIDEIDSSNHPIMIKLNVW